PAGKDRRRQQPDQVNQAADVLAEVILLQPGAKNSIGAGAVTAQVAARVAFEGELVRLPATGDLPRHYAAERFRLRVAVRQAVAVRLRRAPAVRAGQHG